MITNAARSIIITMVAINARSTIMINECEKITDANVIIGDDRLINHQSLNDHAFNYDWFNEPNVEKNARLLTLERWTVLAAEHWVYSDPNLNFIHSYSNIWILNEVLHYRNYLSILCFNGYNEYENRLTVTVVISWLWRKHYMGQNGPGVCWTRVDWFNELLIMYV